MITYNNKKHTVSVSMFMIVPHLISKQFVDQIKSDDSLIIACQLAEYRTRIQNDWFDKIACFSLLTTPHKSTQTISVNAYNRFFHTDLTDSELKTFLNK